MSKSINLYPRSRQYPFDQVCELIVRTLESFEWNVEGLNVKFYEYGRGYKRVSEISGADFKLLYGRIQGRIDSYWNDTAAVDEIVIPKMELHVYEDESGPDFYHYVGNDWDSDKYGFMHGMKNHSKMDKKPRIYLLYTGGQIKPNDPGIQYTYDGRRSPFLVNDNDCGREYEPVGNEPTFFVTDEIFYQITKWLVDNVLSGLLSQKVVLEDVSKYK
jgi:hypothetical protein